ncbi:LysE family transporter [Desulfoplanes sp. PS50]
MISETFGYLLAGAALGLGSGLAPGPLLTLVLTQTLRHGPREGIKVALSPLLTDGPVLVASILALSWIQAYPAPMGIISLVGSLVVAFYGYDCFKIRSKATEPTEIRPRSLKKGLLANLTNPHMYLFWITVGAPTTVRAHATGLLGSAGFLLGFYACLVGSKILLALLTGRFTAFLSSRGYLFLMRFLGLVLFGFALILFRDGLVLLGVWGGG